MSVYDRRSGGYRYFVVGAIPRPSFSILPRHPLGEPVQTALPVLPRTARPFGYGPLPLGTVALADSPGGGIFSLLIGGLLVAVPLAVLSTFVTAYTHGHQRRR